MAASLFVIVSGLNSAHTTGKQLSCDVAAQAAGPPRYGQSEQAGGRRGTGLGLCAVKGIVEAHAGEISVHDAPRGWRDIRFQPRNGLLTILRRNSGGSNMTRREAADVFRHTDPSLDSPRSTHARVVAREAARQ
jgi:hypothetical protein